jgi:HEAT repeat protein
MMDRPDDANATRNRLLLLRTRPVEEWTQASLLAMMRDADDGVRDWATFALAVRDDDGEEVRQALLERADDPDFDTSSEAVWGLARRRDRRALRLLVAALESDIVGRLSVEAAACFARPELVAPLERLREWWDGDPALLEDALARCRGRTVRRGRSREPIPANDPGR